VAIAGIFPFAGFFSKDEILLFSFQRHLGFWILGAVAAIMTSFYMFRSVFMTFYGESRVDHETAHHLHESPPIMTVPLMVLAFLSLVGGLVGIPILEGLNRFGDFVAPVFAPAQAILNKAHHAEHATVGMELAFMGCHWPSPLPDFFARWLPNETFRRPTGWSSASAPAYAGVRQMLD
jgi:NADH-quinone oxidoreductase subunit L